MVVAPLLLGGLLLDLDYQAERVGARSTVGRNTRTCTKFIA